MIIPRISAISAKSNFNSASKLGKINFNENMTSKMSKDNFTTRNCADENDPDFGYNVPFGFAC